MQIEGIFHQMELSVDGLDRKDNGGSRSGGDRRTSQSMGRNPERRNGQERRSGIDRRLGPRYRGELAVERRDTFKVWEGA